MLNLLCETGLVVLYLLILVLIAGPVQPLIDAAQGIPR